MWFTVDLSVNGAPKHHRKLCFYLRWKLRILRVLNISVSTYQYLADRQKQWSLKPVRTPLMLLRLCPRQCLARLGSGRLGGTNKKLQYSYCGRMESILTIVLKIEYH